MIIIGRKGSNNLGEKL